MAERKGYRSTRWAGLACSNDEDLPQAIVGDRLNGGISKIQKSQEMMKRMEALANLEPPTVQKNRQGSSSHVTT